MDKSKTKRFLILLVVMFLIFTLPFLTIFSIVQWVPNVYGETFVGVLKDKYERLCSINTRKIVVIGGSSVPFGLDSEFLEEQTGLPVVNFGLYADLGTKVMLDLSKANINSDDIIIVAPEISEQTLSLYFNAKTTMQAFDACPEMYKYLDGDDKEKIYAASFDFSKDKISYLINKELPKNDGAYKKENFNEYGDNVYPRPYNVMMGNLGEIHFNFLCDFSDKVDTEYEKFILYLNRYTDYVESKGANVYFSFSPLNRDAFAESVTNEQIDRFVENLSLNLHCRVISDIYDYIMDDGYFYDTNFHLNDAGKVVRTVKLVDDLKRLWFDNSVTMLPEDLPLPPGHKENDFVDGDEGCEYFEFEKYKVGDKEYYKVIGLSELGRSIEELVIPNTYEGVSVTQISERAFVDSTILKRLTLGQNISFMASSALSGSSIERLIIPSNRKVTDISVPNGMTGEELMCDGVKNGFKIVVPQGQITDLALQTDYIWGPYFDYMIEE